MTNRYVIEGKVVFMWGNSQPPYCMCCGDPSTPHPHNFNRHIEFDKTSSRFFKPLLVDDMLSLEAEALHAIPSAEGKRVRVTIEILEEAEEKK